MTVQSKLRAISRQLSDSLSRISIGPPVTHVYDPTSYARVTHESYLQYAKPEVEALFLGMNPGPWGMAQTGVPFGEVAHVRDFLGVEGVVGRPKAEHPKRPVRGFECPRSEVSGRRLWSWVAGRFPTADAFFDRFFVWNWCPLAFLEETGRNRTPDKLPKESREPLERLCDQALRDVVAAMQPQMVIGVGGFARKRATHALGADMRIAQILHPSPASPMANRGWAPQVEQQLVEIGLSLPEPTSAR